MIQNSWKKMLAQSGISQKQVAEVAGVSAVVMSGVCNGERILPYEKLVACAGACGWAATDIYPANIITALYGTETEAEQLPFTRVRVQIEPDLVRKLDRLVGSGAYRSRRAAVNALLRKAL